MLINLCGYNVIIDEEDYERVASKKWRIQKAALGNGYFYFRNSFYGHHTRGDILLHRFIMNLLPGDGIVDHINGNTLDNRKTNLRVCNHYANALNRKLRKDSKTGIKGVSFDKARKVYRVYIVSCGGKHFIGDFKSPLDAQKAYINASKEFHKDYSVFNSREKSCVNL